MDKAKTQKHLQRTTTYNIYLNVCRTYSIAIGQLHKSKNGTKFVEAGVEALVLIRVAHTGALSPKKQAK